LQNKFKRRIVQGPDKGNIDPLEEEDVVIGTWIRRIIGALSIFPEQWFQKGKTKDLTWGTNCGGKNYHMYNQSRKKGKSLGGSSDEGGGGVVGDHL